MLDFLGMINNALNHVYNEYNLRIKNINVAYYYFDDALSPYHDIYLGRWSWDSNTKKPKVELRKSIEEFKELKNKIAAKEKKAAAIREDIERKFYKNNYPKANVYKGEYSSSEESF